MRKVSEQLRPCWPKLADLMDASEHDLLADIWLRPVLDSGCPLVSLPPAADRRDLTPRQHRTKLHSTNPIERLNKEVKRRADVVRIFPERGLHHGAGIGAVPFDKV